GRDIDVLTAQPQHVAASRGRTVRKEETNAHLHGFRLRTRHQMKLDDEIALRLEVPGHAVGRDARRLARRPSEEGPVWKLRFAAAAAFVPGSGFVLIAAARQARAIDL